MVHLPEPVTGNQVLAYLRAQNLGKALEEAGGINVTNYTYSVGGDEMKVDVTITQQTPGKSEIASTPDEITIGGKVTKVVSEFNGFLNRMYVEFPLKWKTQWKKYGKNDDWAKSIAKNTIAQGVLQDD